VLQSTERDASVPTETDYRTLARYRRSLRRFLAISEQAARRSGLTPSQHQLLLAIKGHEAPDDPSIGELARSLGLRHNSMAELVDRAQSAELIRRYTDPGDGRRHLVVLLPLGEEKLASLSAVHRDELRRFRAEIAPYLERFA
jgi:DNA-binding MarR family transcriptional regulator